LTATAVAIPVTVVLAFVLTATHDDGGTASRGVTALPAVTVAAPPQPDARTEEACVKIFTQLPVELNGLAPRRTDTSSPFVAAWGEPAVTLRCGVAKPSALNAQVGAVLFDVNGVIWLTEHTQSETTYTAVDRPVYVEVDYPAKQDQAIPRIADAIAVLPQICTAQDAAGNVTNQNLPIC